LRRALSPLAAFVLLANLPAVSSLPLRAADDPFPEGPGKEILMKACTQCHTADPIATLHRTRDEWKDTVDAMKGYGADLNDDDTGVLLDYLAKNFGKQ
jgi:mono/diheme cytochrome c family protein